MKCQNSKKLYQSETRFPFSNNHIQFVISLCNIVILNLQFEKSHDKYIVYIYIYSTQSFQMSGCQLKYENVHKNVWYFTLHDTNCETQWTSSYNYL